MPIEGSTFDLNCDTVIAAVGQSVERTLAESDGLEVTAWGIQAEKRTLATNLEGVFAGGDAVLGCRSGCSRRGSGYGRRLPPSISICGDRRSEVPINGPMWRLRQIDPGELAVLLREIERAPRTPSARIDMEQRLTSFEEIEAGLDPETGRPRIAAMSLLWLPQRPWDAGCGLLATELDADPLPLHRGDRRSFEQDASHPEILYEPGKCILCDACVRISAEAGEDLGVALIGRGFDVSMSVPFGEPLSEGLKAVAARCAEACPTGALALRSARSCDLPDAEVAALSVFSKQERRLRSPRSESA